MKQDHEFCEADPMDAEVTVYALANLSVNDREVEAKSDLLAVFWHT